MDKSKGCRSRHVRDRQMPSLHKRFTHVCMPISTSSKKTRLQGYLKAGDIGTRAYPTFAKTPFSLTVL